MKLYSINTGCFKLDGGAMFGVVPKSIWNKLNPADENNLCTWALRCLLIIEGDRKILVDTGMGNKQDAKFFSHYQPTQSLSFKAALAPLHLGVEDITFLNHRDGWLTVNIERRKEVVRVIRKVRPDRMVIQSPERNWDRIFSSHPDHMAAGEIAIQAVYPDSRNAFAFEDLLKEEKLEPWRVREVWVMSHPQPDHYVDITSNINRKLAALKAHHSQTSHMENLEEMIKEWGTRIAKQAGAPEGSYAEAFKIVNTD